MKDLQNEKIRLLEEYIGLYKTKPNPMLARQTWIKCVNNVEQRLSTLTEQINSEPQDEITESQVREYVKEHEDKFSLMDFAKWVKSLILFLMMIIPMSLTAQKSTINAVYISYQPVDFGFGLRADYHLGSVGLYNSLSYGDGSIYRYYDMRDHYKVTMGIRIPMRDYLDNKYGINIGINYHTLGSYVKESITWDTHLFNPWSFELGISLYCWGKFALGIRTDILRNEPCLDLGYAF